MDFSQITQHLYLGSRMDRTDWHIMAALNVTVNVNLMAEGQDQFTAAAPEVSLWLPTPDWFGPSVETLRVGAYFIDMMVRQGRSVYVHCNMGVGRAPTLVTAYLMLTGLNQAQALEQVAKQRPVVKLNSTQLGYLREFAASLPQTQQLTPVG